MKDNEKVFKKISDEYVEYQGTLLKKEMYEPAPETPGLDKFVKRKFTFPFIRRAIRGVAACVALAAILYGINFVLPGQDGGLIMVNIAEASGFFVTHAEPDNGESIYFINQYMGDHVVMTVTAKKSLDIEGLTPLQHKGQQFYTKTDNDYKILIFNRGELTYTLSCRYDINTLIELSENIL